MKKILSFLFIVIVLFSCSTNDDNNNANQNSILGRWHLVGFEETVMYQFTDDNLRHTLYSTDGTFGGLETAIPNPNSWSIENNKLVVDLNFGNSSTESLSFRCNGNVVDLISDNGTSRLFREGYNILNCNE
ncbi:MAG: hypothetical protein ACON5F_07595 [Jejuia sp.]